MGERSLPSLTRQSYLLVTEDDFARAAGANKVMVEGLVVGGVGRVSGERYV